MTLLNTWKAQPGVLGEGCVWAKSKKNSSGSSDYGQSLTSSVLSCLPPSYTAMEHFLPFLDPLATRPHEPGTVPEPVPISRRRNKQHPKPHFLKCKWPTVPYIGQGRYANTVQFYLCFNLWIPSHWRHVQMHKVCHSNKDSKHFNI